MPTNLESLRNLSEKVTGKASEATSTAEAINEIAEGYTGSSGGGGASSTINTDSNINTESASGKYTSSIEIKEV